MIAGSESGQFLVVVNDGFNSWSDTVGGLAVAGNPPSLLLGEPIDGSTYRGNAKVPFTAWASDREDGSIPFSQVSWVSSLDGVLDTSSDLGVYASDLTLGVHRITATVTDSDGNVTTSTVAITILADDASGPGTPVGHASGGEASPGPSPSASPSPEPSATSGTDETPVVEPSAGPEPSPSPSLAAAGSAEPGSGSWLWWFGLVVIVAAAIAGAWLWYRRRFVREP